MAAVESALAQLVAEEGGSTMGTVVVESMGPTSLGDGR